MSEIRSGAYQQTDRLIEWLSEENLVPMEQSAFNHWVGIRNLTALVDKCVRGEVPRFVASDAIDQYNRENNTSLSFDEIAGKYSHNFIFSDTAEWVIYTDLPGLGHLIRGEYTNPLEAIQSAPGDCQWMILWFTNEHEVVVHRSPHRGWRNFYDPENLQDDSMHAHGIEHGPLLSYVLPPEVEGSIREEIHDCYLASQPSQATAK